MEYFNSHVFAQNLDLSQFGYTFWENFDSPEKLKQEPRKYSYRCRANLLGDKKSLISLAYIDRTRWNLPCIGDANLCLERPFEYSTTSRNYTADLRLLWIDSAPLSGNKAPVYLRPLEHNKSRWFVRQILSVEMTFNEKPSINRGQNFLPIKTRQNCSENLSITNHGQNLLVLQVITLFTFVDRFDKP